MPHAQSHVLSLNPLPRRPGPDAWSAAYATSRRKEVEPLRTILVIEDDEDIRDAVLAILDCGGFAATGVADGFEALAYLHDHAPPGLILLDFRMPHCDGRRFRALQREDPCLRAIPVILFSSEDDCETLAATLGTAGWLPKPVDAARLLRTVGYHLQARA